MALSVFHLGFIDHEHDPFLNLIGASTPVGYVISAAGANSARKMAQAHYRAEMMSKISRPRGFAPFEVPVVWTNIELCFCKRIGSSFNVKEATIHLISSEGS